MGPNGSKGINLNVINQHVQFNQFRGNPERMDSFLSHSWKLLGLVGFLDSSETLELTHHRPRFHYMFRGAAGGLRSVTVGTCSYCCFGCVGFWEAFGEDSQGGQKNMAEIVINQDRVSPRKKNMAEVFANQDRCSPSFSWFDSFMTVCIGLHLPFVWNTYLTPRCRRSDMHKPWAIDRASFGCPGTQRWH